MLPDFEPFFSETESESESVSESVSESEKEESQSSLQTAAPFAKELRIVVSEGASETLLHRARALGEALAERTGLSYTIRDDVYLLAPNPDVYEIVLGKTNHTESLLWLASLKTDDYICVAGEAVALLGGRSEQTTIKALDAFCEKLLPLVTREQFMETGVAILERGSYDRGVISFNGVDLFDWQIVYEGELPRLQAELLRDEIQARSGYELEICTGASADASKRSMRLSLEAGDTGMAHLIPTPEGVTLLGETGVGLRCAVEKLIRMLWDSADAEGNCQSALQVALAIPVERNRFHCSLLLGTDDLRWESPAEIVDISDWIWKGEQDAVAMAEMQEETVRSIRQNVFDLYEWQTNSLCELGIGKDASALGAEQAHDGLLGGVRLGEEKGGILWLIVRAGSQLPAWVFQENLPFVVTVYGEESGELGEESAKQVDLLYHETVEANGKPLFVGVYSTVGQIHVEIEVLDKKAGVLDLWIERLF